jgi:hypothetical protein
MVQGKQPPLNFEDFMMTTFVNPNQLTRHVGAERIEHAIDNAQQLRRGFSATQGLATLLLSALAAAVMVVAYQVMDSMAEGHLLVMWVALWATAFAALVLFAGTAREGAARLKSGLDQWSHRVARARADERLMQAAVRDPRVMADLRVAIDRACATGPESHLAHTKPALQGLNEQFSRMGVRAQRLSRPYY